MKDRIREILKHHQGPDNCITMNNLYIKVTESFIVPFKRYDQTRVIRSLVKDLREEGTPIGNRSGIRGGYFWAQCDKELESTIAIFHERAFSSFKQEAALKRISIDELIEQYKLEINPQEKEEDVTSH